VRGWALVRNIGLVAYAIAFVWSFAYNGLPVARLAVLAWVGGAFVVGNIGKSWLLQIRMVRDLVFYTLMWMSYDYSRGIADTFGFPLQVEAPRNIDKVLFFGHDSNQVIQDLLFRRTTPWYEVMFSIVYFTHFLFPVAASVYLWVRNRDEWIRYIRRFATVLFVGVACFVVLPTAPPWMAASRQHPYQIMDQLSRTTARGWSELGLDTVGVLLIRGREWANPTAALPSLHAAFALFLVLFFWNRIPDRRIRWATTLFPILMALSLMYFAEHYLVDILAGWALVIGSFWFWNRWEKRRTGTSVDHAITLTRIHTPTEG